MQAGAVCALSLILLLCGAAPGALGDTAAGDTPPTVAVTDVPASPDPVTQTTAASPALPSPSPSPSPSPQPPASPSPSPQVSRHPLLAFFCAESLSLCARPDARLTICALPAPQYTTAQYPVHHYTRTTPTTHNIYISSTAAKPLSRASVPCVAALPIALALPNPCQLPKAVPNSQPSTHFAHPIPDTSCLASGEHACIASAACGYGAGIG